MEAVTRDPELGYRAKDNTKVGWPIAFGRKDILNQSGIHQYQGSLEEILERRY